MFKMKIKLVVDKATSREELLGFGAFFNKLADDFEHHRGATPVITAPSDPMELHEPEVPEPEQSVELPKADPDPTPTERRRRRTKAEMEALRAELADKAAGTTADKAAGTTADKAAGTTADKANDQVSEPSASTEPTPTEENEDFSFGAVNMLAVQCSKTFGPAKVREIIRAAGGNMLRDLDDLGLMTVAGELKKLIAGE